MGYFHAAETRQRGNGWEFLYISYMYHFRAGWQSLQPGHEPSYSHLGCTCHTVLMVKNDRGWIARKRFTQECRRISSLHFFFPLSNTLLHNFIYFIFLHPKSNVCDPWAAKQFLCTIDSPLFERLKFRVWVYQ